MACFGRPAPAQEQAPPPHERLARRKFQRQAAGPIVCRLHQDRAVGAGQGSDAGHAHGASCASAHQQPRKRRGAGELFVRNPERTGAARGTHAARRQAGGCGTPPAMRIEMRRGYRQRGRTATRCGRRRHPNSPAWRPAEQEEPAAPAPPPVGPRPRQARRQCPRAARPSRRDSRRAVPTPEPEAAAPPAAAARAAEAEADYDIFN